jgi:hypothetical protein
MYNRGQLMDAGFAHLCGSLQTGDDAMDKTVIASAIMTHGQIDTAVEQLRAAMRKHRSEISKEGAQGALGLDNLGMRMFAGFRELAEAMSKFIIHRIKVNRNRPPRVTLQATGRNLYVTDSVVDAMPRGEGEEAEVVYFKPEPEAYKNGVISDDDLEKEYAKRGLVPADPYSLSADNEANPDFADTYPKGTHWKDEQGKWCFAAFHRWYSRRIVSVYRSGGDVWNDRWWFAGRRK